MEINDAIETLQAFSGRITCARIAGHTHQLTVASVSEGDASRVCTALDSLGAVRPKLFLGKVIAEEGLEVARTLRSRGVSIAGSLDAG